MYLKTREEILDLFRGVTAGLVPLRDFEKRFVYLFLDREGWPIIEPRDREFFNLVLEKMGWTSEELTHEERSLGWIGFNEFKQWLSDSLAEYLSEGQDG